MNAACEALAQPPIEHDQAISAKTLGNQPIATMQDDSTGVKQPTFFLIVGSGRCGTTLLANLLSKHPQIALTNEARAYDFLHFALQLAHLPDHQEQDFAFETPARLRGIVTNDYTQAFGRIFAEHLPSILLSFYRDIFPTRNFTHFGDKMPLPIPAAHARALIPGTKLIALIRDPRDYVCSAMSYSQIPHISANYPSMRTTIERFCAHWMLCASGIQELGLKAIRYEDMIAMPSIALKQATETLGIGWTPELDIALTTTPFLRHHATSPSAMESINRWRRDLPEAHAQAVQRICGPMMQQYNYPIA